LENAVGIIDWGIAIVVLVVGWYMGWVGPTGFAARSPAEKERDRQQDIAAKWLKKDGERTNGPR
jgi:hypothetical protein